MAPGDKPGRQAAGRAAASARVHSHHREPAAARAPRRRELPVAAGRTLRAASHARCRRCDGEAGAGSRPTTGAPGAPRAQHAIRAQAARYGPPGVPGRDTGLQAVAGVGARRWAGAGSGALARAACRRPAQASCCPLEPTGRARGPVRQAPARCRTSPRPRRAWTVPALPVPVPVRRRRRPRGPSAVRLALRVDVPRASAPAPHRYPTPPDASCGAPHLPSSRSLGR